MAGYEHVAAICCQFLGYCFQLRQYIIDYAKAAPCEWHAEQRLCAQTCPNHKSLNWNLRKIFRAAFEAEQTKRKATGIKVILSRIYLISIGKTEMLIC